MDLALALFNKLRGQDIEAPLFDPTKPAATSFVLTPAQQGQEKRNLALLEPSTAEFVKGILLWARTTGYRALLGETYRSVEDQANIDPGRTAITPGKIGWHQVGRAFHLILKDPRGQLDKSAYKAVGEEVRRRGGEWLGDFVIQTPKGGVVDLAHFEYHPGLEIGPYRKSALAIKELAQSEKRAAKYA
jgi:hypothetical protein